MDSVFFRGSSTSSSSSSTDATDSIRVDKKSTKFLPLQAKLFSLRVVQVSSNSVFSRIPSLGSFCTTKPGPGAARECSDEGVGVIFGTAGSLPASVGLNEVERGRPRPHRAAVREDLLQVNGCWSFYMKQ